MSSIALTIVVPAYHESDRIKQSLTDLAQAINDYLDQKTTEVIVVSADNQDPTAAIAQECAHLFKHFNVIQPGPRVGKGRDVKLGILAGQGEYRMFMDADMATPLHHLRQVKQQMNQNAQVAIGVRPLAGIHTGLRKFISEFGNILVRTLLTPGISDSQCGFKLFRADCAQVMFDRMQIVSWGFDMELLTIARIHKYSIATMDIPDWHDPKVDGLVGDSGLKVALQTGLELLTILKNRILGKYR